MSPAAMKCQAISLRSVVESGIAARTIAAYIGRDTGWELGISGADLPEHQASYAYNTATGFLETAAGGVVPDASTTDNPHDYNAADTFTYGYTYTQTAGGPRVGDSDGTKQDFIPYTLTKNGGVLQSTRTHVAGSYGPRSGMPSGKHRGMDEPASGSRE